MEGFTLVVRFLSEDSVEEISDKVYYFHFKVIPIPCKQFFSILYVFSDILLVSDCEVVDVEQSLEGFDLALFKVISIDYISLFIQVIAAVV